MRKSLLMFSLMTIVIFVSLLVLSPIEASSIATVDIKPDTLNLEMKGEWITVYIELPEPYDVNDINVSTVLLGDVPAEHHPIEVGDYDDDSATYLMVKFDSSSVIVHIWSIIYHMIPSKKDFVDLTISGELNDGTPFEGSDTIRIIHTEDR